MSDSSSQLSEIKAHVNDAGAQHTEESLEQQLESLDLNDAPSDTVSQQSRTVKRSARYLLDRLSERRLAVIRINFTPGVTQAGKGSHGEVVVATLTVDDGTTSEAPSQLAVKNFIIGENIDEEKFLRTFANEVRVLDGLHHRNIIKLVGFVEDMENRIAWLVFPWEANGNVREFLLSGEWELPERVSLIKDVTSGLEYLHTRQPPIRHGDLKSLNILVNSDHQAVITDFGSARIQTEARGSETTSGSRRRQTASTGSDLTACVGSPEVTVSTTNAELTLTGPSWSFRWAAPEILNEEEPCLASDIWALGWIAWEVVTDNYPFPEAKTNTSITVKVVKGLLPLLYDDVQLSQLGDLCYLMVRCWKYELRERPTATECWRAIKWVDWKTRGLSNPVCCAFDADGRNAPFTEQIQGGLKFFEDSVAIARSFGDERTMAKTLDLAADCHRSLANYEMATEFCNQSLEIYTHLGNSWGRASALYRLGEIHLTRFRYTEAEEPFKQALAIYVRIHNDRGQANALLRLGNVHHGRAEYAQAEEHLNKALSIYTSIGDSLGRANVLQLLGVVYQARSNHVEAEQCFDQALAISVGIGYRVGQANALRRLGMIHNNQSNYAKAEECFNQSLVIFASVGDTLGRANSLLGLGEAKLRQARYSEAKSLLSDAAEISNQINYGWAQNQSKKLLAEVVEAEKSPTEASP